jgi:4-hydroxybenzoate polyprenyltransferase
MSALADAFHKLREFGRLARFEGGGFSIVAVFGFLAASGGAVDTVGVAIVFVINLFFLMGGCIHNDLLDMRHDRRADKFKDRPLIRGTITPMEAAVTMSACCFGSLGLAWLFTRSTVAVGVLTGAIGLAMLYNRFSKTVFGADLFFVISAGLLCSFGGVSALTRSGMLLNPTPMFGAVLGIVMLDHFFFNALEGGLKDYEHDGLVEARTAARRLFRSADGSTRLLAWAGVMFMTLKVISVALAFLPFVAFRYAFTLWQITLLCLASAAVLLCTWKLIRVTPADKERVGRLVYKQEAACRSLVPLMLVGLCGATLTALLLVAPFVWFLFFNTLLHGNAFANSKTK